MMIDLLDHLLCDCGPRDYVNAHWYSPKQSNDSSLKGVFYYSYSPRGARRVSAPRLFSTPRGLLLFMSYLER